jgi:1,4-dihydroxy-2-naphthoate octaprenyltransferase
MNYQEYIKPELMILVPVLMFIGAGVKQLFDAKWVPIVLGVVGIVLAGLWTLATSDIATGQELLLGLFTAVVQGILCAAGAVYGHQVVKQLKE